MKLLFLDIDGVLNGHEKHPDSPYTTIRPDCIQRLNRVIKATDCKIVISSAWRYMLLHPKGNRRHKPAMQLLGFQYMLHTHGLASPSVTIIGHTCSDEEIPERGQQILAFVSCAGPLESWAVVDDDPMAIELGDYAHLLVRTNPKTGLTDKDVRRLVKILGK